MRKVKIKAEINEVENIKLCLKILVLCSKNQYNKKMPIV